VKTECQAEKDQDRRIATTPAAQLLKVQLTEKTRRLSASVEPFCIDQQLAGFRYLVSKHMISQDSLGKGFDAETRSKKLKCFVSRVCLLEVYHVLQHSGIFPLLARLSLENIPGS
jgi:hypothetical protein